MRNFTLPILLLLSSCNSNVPIESDKEMNDMRSTLDASDLDIAADFSKDISGVRPFTYPFISDQLINCVGPLPDPGLCDWASAAFDVVLMKVTEVSLSTVPSVDAKTGRVLQSCGGRVYPGIKLKGVIEKSIRANTGEIVVGIGNSQIMDFWVPEPYRSDLGELAWTLETNGIFPGDLIGMVLHKNPKNGSLSILGEQFFDVKNDKKIRFAINNNTGCVEPYPLITGMRFEELQTRFEACAPSESIEDRIRAKAEYWNYRSYSDLGICHSN